MAKQIKAMTDRQRQELIDFRNQHVKPYEKPTSNNMAMAGGIHSDQRCSVCGNTFADNFKNALECPLHPEQKASRFRVYFKNISKRFKSYEESARFLNGLRYETDKGTYDQKEYRQDNPLSFDSLATQWLFIRQKQMKYSSYRKIKNHIMQAMGFFEDKNIKDFKPKDFDSFLLSLNVSSKTKHNALSALHQFFQWLLDNDDIVKMPKFPKVKFSLARRNTIDKTTQGKIIDEVFKIAKSYNVKIGMGIKFLATYFNVRPHELLQVKEKDINLDSGTILISHTKENNPKLIFLIDEDIELLRQFPEGIGKAYQELYFFRHRKGIKGIAENKQFGNHLFYTYWKKACKNLNISNVDLYGGTRHSSVQALREFLTPEQIRLASGHTTNKAFERYYMLSHDDLKKTYSMTRQNQAGKGLARGFK